MTARLCQTALVLSAAALGGCGGPTFWDRRVTIDCVQFSADGKLLAVGGRNVGTGGFADHGDVKLYHGDSGRLLYRITLAHRVSQIAFDPQGEWLAIVTGIDREPPYHDTLVVYRVASGDEPSRAFEVPHMPSIWGIEFDRDSSHVVAFGSENATVWRTATWSSVLTVPGKIADAEFSADGRFLAIVKWRHAVAEVWDVAAQRKITEFSGRRPLVLDNTGKWWVVFDPRQSALILWNIQQQAKDFILDAPGSVCVALKTSGDGKLAAVVGAAHESVLAPAARRVYIWDLPSRTRLYGPIRDIPKFASRLAFANGGEFLVIGGWRRTALLDVETGQLTKLPSNLGGFRAASRGRLAASNGESIAVWKVDGGTAALLWEDRWRRHPWSPLE